MPLPLLPFLLLPAPAPPLQSGATGSLSGAVRERSTDRPLAGATVRISAPPLHGERITATGPRGEFHFDLLLPGTYAVRVELSGYATLEGQVEIAQGRLVNSRWILAQAPAAAGGMEPAPAPRAGCRRHAQSLAAPAHRASAGPPPHGFPHPGAGPSHPALRDGRHSAADPEPARGWAPCPREGSAADPRKPPLGALGERPAISWSIG